MMVYALSPAAYSGLLKLAGNSTWCGDYDRILRYLDVVEAATEAQRISVSPKMIVEQLAGWQLVSFLGSAEHLRLQRHRNDSPPSPLEDTALSSSIGEPMIAPAESGPIA
jgi:hypothetical protein